MKRGARRRRQAGLTLTEVVVSSAVLMVLCFGMLTFEVGAQGAFSDQQVLANIHEKVRLALTRMAQDTGKALTVTGSELSTLWPATGSDARGLQFREVIGADTAGPLFGPTIVFAGPHTGTPTGADCSGIVRLRESNLHTSLSTITALAGSDSLFGTFDDLTSSVGSDGQRVVEVLIPSTLAPSSTTEPMLRVDLSGRVVTFTVRVNYRRSNGTYLLPDDLVIDERVALRR